VICSDQPVLDRCVVFDFVTQWKEGCVIMLNRKFARLVISGMGREGAAAHGVKVMFTPCRVLKRPKFVYLYVFMFCIMSYII
jgi:hypothetical protein